MLPEKPTRERGVFWHLNDGKGVFLRPLGPQDRERIRVGLSRMSDRSRYLRFFAGTQALTEEQLRYLTELDQVNHVAWCALDPDEKGLPGLGIVRFRRSDDDPSVAEWAVAIIDAFQRRGLGRLFTALICVLAGKRDVRILRCSILEENQPVVEWLGRLGGEIHRREGEYEVTLAVEEAVNAPRDNPSAKRFARLVHEISQYVTG